MHYVLDEKGNRVESLSKEEILAVMQQAIDNKSLEGIEADSAFVSKLKCCVDGGTFGMAFVTQAKYNELKENGQLIKDTLYYIIDDATEENIESSIELLAKEINAISGAGGTIEKIITGEMPVSILKPDGSMASFTIDQNGVLKTENSIISRKKLLPTGGMSWERDQSGISLNDFYSSNESLSGKTFEIHVQVYLHSEDLTFGTYIFRFKAESDKILCFPIRNDTSISEDQYLNIFTTNVIIEMGDYAKSLQIAPVFKHTCVGIGNSTKTSTEQTLAGSVTKVYEIIE